MEHKNKKNGGKGAYVWTKAAKEYTSKITDVLPIENLVISEEVGGKKRKQTHKRRRTNRRRNHTIKKRKQITCKRNQKYKKCVMKGG